MIWHKAGMFGIFVLCLILQSKHCPLKSPCSHSCQTRGCWTDPKTGEIYWPPEGKSVQRLVLGPGLLLEELRCFYWLLLNNPELCRVLGILSWTFPFRSAFLLSNTLVNLKLSKYNIFITSCRPEALFRTLSCRTVSISGWWLPVGSISL